MANNSNSVTNNDMPSDKEKNEVITNYFKEAGNLLYILILCFLLLIIFLILQNKYIADTLEILEHQFYIVQGGSMSPTIEAGSMVITQNANPEELTRGDVITYKSLGEGALTTHRIVKIEKDKNGLHFITRGDANDTNDALPVTEERVIGKVTRFIPYAGYIARFAQTRQGVVVMLIIPSLALISFELRNLLKRANKVEQKPSREEK